MFFIIPPWALLKENNFSRKTETLRVQCFGAQPHLHLLRKKNHKQIQKIAFFAWQTIYHVRSAPNFISFGLLRSSQQNRQIGSEQCMNSKHFYRPRICLFCRELLRCPNDLKIGADLTHQIIYHTKKQIFFVNIDYCITNGDFNSNLSL